ncbi:MAG: MFS transporter [Desulfobacula sp.]|nr:MFS transporter [Desulfobacula sp.]
MFFAQMTTMIGFSSIFPFLPFYLESIGKVSSLRMELLVGLVFSGQAFTMMIASPFWGALSDRFGRKLMVERAMFGGAIILTLMAFARSAEELVILRAIQGLITGTVGAANALVASSVPRKRMGYAMGVLQVGMGVGVSIGPVIGGIMADMFGYRSAFYITGATLLISGIAVHFGVNENFEKPDKATRKQRHFISEWQHVLRAKGVAITFCLRFMNQLGRVIFIPILPLFAQSIIGESTRINSFTGLIVGVTSVTMTLSSIYLGKLGDRIGHRPIVIGSSLACGLFLGLQVFITTGWQLVLFHALFGLGLGGIIPSVSALLSNYTSSGEEGSVYGIDNSVVSGARTLAPLLGVSIAMWFGLRSVFGIAALLYLVASLLAVFKLPRKKKAIFKPQGLR